MFDRLLQVLVITVPIFGLIGLGKLLYTKKWLTDETCHTINRIIANLSLPALIFLAVANTSFEELIRWPVIIGGLVPMVLSPLLMYPLSLAFRINDASRAPFLYSPFWANVSYMGIPLAIFAFGEQGKVNVAIINAFTIPMYVIVGTIIISLHNHETADSIASRIKHAVLNPIPLSAVFGILVSLGVDGMSLRSTESILLLASTDVFSKSLELVGKMGLPLALLSIGAALRVNRSTKGILVVSISCLARLVLGPLTSLLIFRFFFPDANPVDMASCVLVMSTPIAVASYVISTKAGVAQDVAGEIVAGSTLLSIITIPIWTYILLSIIGSA